MKRYKKKRIFSWTAVVIWMAVIFLLSAQTANQSGKLSGGIVRWLVALFYRGFNAFSVERQNEILSVWSLVIRKGAHFSEYAVLAILLSNAFRLMEKQTWVLPVVISALYAVTDEIHQYFVPGRACRLLDMGMDTCGAIFGTALFALGIYLWNRRKKPTP